MLHMLKRISLFLMFILIMVSSKMLIGTRQKVVLISGAASGIGLATAEAFQKKGWKVWAGFHEYVSDELKQIESIRHCHLDVTNDQLVQTAINHIIEEDGRIDALINNAGYGLIGAEECVTIQEAQHLFDVNVWGVLRLVQAVLPIMRQKKSGHIINISSGVGVHSFPGLGLYSASKFALEGLSESLAVTCAPWDIKVSIVEPGFVKNNWGSHCVIGSRACDETVYKKLTQSICDMLATPQGQSCEEVAALLVKIAENPQPNMRYQTTNAMTDYIAKKLVDPTGNVLYKKNLQFINSLINK